GAARWRGRTGSRRPGRGSRATRRTGPTGGGRRTPCSRQPPSRGGARIGRGGRAPSGSGEPSWTSCHGSVGRRGPGDGAAVDVLERRLDRPDRDQLEIIGGGGGDDSDARGGGA